MALSIYKSGQGYWTRMLSGIGAGAIVLAGVGWVWNQMSIMRDPIYWQSGMAVAVIALFGALLYWLLLKSPRIVDFMIATENEMKKVNWPSRRDVAGSTVVVIGGTLLIALFLWVINLVFAQFFMYIKVLEGGAGQ